MRVRQRTEQSVFERVAQLGHASRLPGDIVQGLQRGSQAHDTRQVLGAAAPTTLLAAQRLRRKCNTLAQQQRTNAFGAVQLVGRQRHRIRAAGRKIEGLLADELGRVHMQQRAGRLRERRHLGHGHQGAGFIVGRHERDQRHVRADQRSGRLPIQRAVAPHRNQVHRSTRVRQRARQAQVACVLNAAEHDAPTLGGTGGEQAAHRHVVGFGGTAGKDDLDRLAAQYPRHCRARKPQGAFGLLPRAVLRRCVGPHARECRQHGRNDRRGGWRGGIVVKVNHGVGQQVRARTGVRGQRTAGPATAPAVRL